MSEYHVSYHAVNSYEHQVTGAFFRFIIVPADNEFQKLIKMKLRSNVPVTWWISERVKDGKELYVRANKPFTEFILDLETRIIINQVNPFNRPILPREIQWKTLETTEWKVENAYFLQAGHPKDRSYIPPEWMDKFPAPNTQQGMLDHLITLREFLFSKIKFCPESTDVHTKAIETYQLKAGVCQDFAHLYSAIARRQGIPTRYVCGYLCQGKNYKGAGQLHAWVECHVPGSGWIGIDPSNNLMADNHHIKIAHGVDYGDCAPIKGVILNGGDHTSEHTVFVHQAQSAQQ